MHLSSARAACPPRASALFALLSAAAALLLPRTTLAFEHRNSVGIGYQSGHIATDSAGSFHFRSFPLSFAGRYGGDWAAQLRMSLLFPLRARQGDEAFSPRAEYDKTQQYDAFLAPNFRFTRLLGWEIDAGLGAHFHFVRFRSTHYVEWSSAAMGMGLSAAGRTPLSEEFWGGHGELGLHGDINYDFIDFSRGGDLTGGVQAQFHVSVGWAMGTAQ